MQDNEHISLQCKFEVRKLSFDSVYLGDNRYNIISPERSNIHFNCPNQNDNYVMTIPSLRYFELAIARGCFTSFLDEFNTETPYIFSSWNSSFLSAVAEPLIKDFNSENKDKEYLTIGLSVVGLFVGIFLVGLALCCLKKIFFVCKY
jgi:hypothetical protein